MGTINQKRYIELRLVQSDGTLELGRLITDFQVFFTRDAVPCTDIVSSVELGNGRYVIQYTPTKVGHDFIEIYDSPTDIRTSNASDIVADDLSAIVNLTQDYGGVGRLRPNIRNPQNCTLYVFSSSNWEAGRTTPTYAIAATGLDLSGNWTSSPLSVLHSTYHIVAIATNGSKTVIAAYLGV